MNMFQLVVIGVATVILIISLTWFGITIHNSKTVDTSAYPPTFSDCPDYWEKDSTGKCIIPNMRNIPISLDVVAAAPSATDGDAYYINNPGYTPGYTAAVNTTPATVDFSVAAWKTYGLNKGKKSDECIYREWANRVGVVWDGITNYNQCD